MALALAGLEATHVSLLLSHPITNQRMVGPLLDNTRVELIEPTSRFERGASQPLTHKAAASALARLVASGVDAVIVRGLEAATKLARKRGLRGSIWPYLTDIPQHQADIEPSFTRAMRSIMAVSPVLLCQTEEMRSFFEQHIPWVEDKARVLPPAIPDDIVPSPIAPPSEDDLRLCYAGKFARAWKTVEMCALPAQLADGGIRARLTMVGDKINRDADDPSFVADARKALEESPGVDWVGGVSRAEAMNLMGAAHIGMSWRSAALNQSLELSTKLLEYSAMGRPPVLNRTPMHERLFGSGYPLFVDDANPALDVLETVARHPDTFWAAAQMSSGVAAEFTLAKASERLAQIVSEQL